eukprot:1151607-Pelagomonas_calceolata.AAC.6
MFGASLRVTRVTRGPGVGLQPGTRLLVKLSQPASKTENNSAKTLSGVLKASLAAGLHRAGGGGGAVHWIGLCSARGYKLGAQEEVRALAWRPIVGAFVFVSRAGAFACTGWTCCRCWPRPDSGCPCEATSGDLMPEVSCGGRLWCWYYLYWVVIAGLRISIIVGGRVECIASLRCISMRPLIVNRVRLSPLQIKSIARTGAPAVCSKNGPSCKYQRKALGERKGRASCSAPYVQRCTGCHWKTPHHDECPIKH